MDAPFNETGILFHFMTLAVNKAIREKRYGLRCLMGARSGGRGMAGRRRGVYRFVGEGCICEGFF